MAQNAKDNLAEFSTKIEDSDDDVTCHDTNSQCDSEDKPPADSHPRGSLETAKTDTKNCSTEEIVKENDCTAEVVPPRTAREVSPSDTITEATAALILVPDHTKDNTVAEAMTSTDFSGEITSSSSYVIPSASSEKITDGITSSNTAIGFDCAGVTGSNAYDSADVTACNISDSADVTASGTFDSADVTAPNISNSADVTASNISNSADVTASNISKSADVTASNISNSADVTVSSTSDSADITAITSGSTDVTASSTSDSADVTASSTSDSANVTASSTSDSADVTASNISDSADVITSNISNSADVTASSTSDSAAVTASSTSDSADVTASSTSYSADATASSTSDSADVTASSTSDSVAVTASSTSDAAAVTASSTSDATAVTASSTSDAAAVTAITFDAAAVTASAKTSGSVDVTAAIASDLEVINSYSSYRMTAFIAGTTTSETETTLTSVTPFSTGKIPFFDRWNTSSNIATSTNKTEFCSNTTPITDSDTGEKFVSTSTSKTTSLVTSETSSSDTTVKATHIHKEQVLGSEKPLMRELDAWCADEEGDSDFLLEEQSDSFGWDAELMFQIHDVDPESDCLEDAEYTCPLPQFKSEAQRREAERMAEKHAVDIESRDEHKALAQLDEKLELGDDEDDETTLGKE